MTNVSSNRGGMIVLAYLGPLAIVPFLVEKRDAEVRWHAKHGLVLMAGELVLLFTVSLITGLVSLQALALGCALSIVMIALAVGILVVHVVAILKGLAGTRLIIPGISGYADRF
jgi:hypothetical protein